MAQYQMAVIYSRIGKPDEAAKIFRALADKPTCSCRVPGAAGTCRRAPHHEAARGRSVYQQLKKEFPDTAIAEARSRLDALSPKS